MALRFVTLSPQNQELVEQLVQDHVDTDGAPFDLDVRPVPADFPTDALEGAPATTEESVDEGYRLTVRRTEPNIQAEALQALAEASPVEADGESTSGDETEDAGSDDVSGFEIVSGPTETEESSDDAATDDDEGVPTDTTESEAEQPELDWPADLMELAETAGSGSDEPTPPLELDEGAPEEATDIPMTVAEFLPTPLDFDDGPEVIDDVESEDIGSPAFDVSLPENDDEPDSTPMMPDEGRDDVTVHSDGDPEAPVRRRRLWPFGLAALFLFALTAGFLWPQISTWYEGRRAGLTDGSEKTVPASTVEARPPAESGATSTDPVSGADGGEGVGSVVTGADASDASTGAVAVDQPDAAPEAMAAPANTVTSIAVEPGQHGSTITIRANGGLEDGAISMESLPSPPRVLVRIRGIRNDFRPYTIESATPEVTRLRIGLHDERRPPELWVVVDLTGGEIAVQGIDIRGDTAEIELAGR